MTPKSTAQKKQIPPYLEDAEIYEALSREAASRVPPVSFTRIIREAVREYVFHHELLDKPIPPAA
jgi:hypothetical protein